jgi:dihydrofolate reductase
MRLSLIAALSRNLVIGTDHGMPWHLPHDLKRFRALTWGKPIVLGRKTFSVLGKPLPGRDNIVLTRDATFRSEGVQVAHTIHGALDLAEKSLRERGADEVMIIGGAQVYEAYLPWAERLYLSVVEGDYQGTAHFPGQIPDLAAWQVTRREHCPIGVDVPTPYTFLQLDRAEARSGSLGSLLDQALAVAG